jgi:guanosine-3',5'-bis(diphosphate) 3'-pyrophosphohydrolase
MPEQGHELALVMSASKFAAAKHKKQKRKDNETPYINHPLEVAELLTRIAKVSDPEVIVAALLHDTVEDTDTKPEEIRTAFGDRVLSMVMECTDDKSLPKPERKRLQVVNASHKSDEAKLIKIADKISNIRDIVECPPPDWIWERRWDYLKWAEDVFAGLRGVSYELDEFFIETVEKSRKSLEVQKAKL